MTNDGQQLRTIMKYDVGADGFMKMIYVLAAAAVVVLAVGIFFVAMVMKDFGKIS